jgi:glycosyltransferase involved in cell wall biosynthesis
MKVAAKIDDADKKHFESRIKPLLRTPEVDYIGEVDQTEKHELLRNAIALVFPINWPEPFGLVMAEALACGTPVIAFKNGSVPEIITHGVDGFIVRSVDEAIEAVQSIGSINRSACRATFEQRFTADRMVNEYLNLYQMTAGEKNLPYAFAG